MSNEVVEEVGSSEEGSDEPEVSSESDADDIDAKLDAAERQLGDNSAPTTAAHSEKVNESTVGYESDDADGKWRLEQLIEMAQSGGSDKDNSIVDFDSSGDRLFVMFSNMSLVEISIKTGQLVQEINVATMEGLDMDENEPRKVQAFALFKDLNMIALSTTEAVYLIDFENEVKYNMKIARPNVVFIAQVDIYIVMMVASDEDSSEATLTCRMLYGSDEGSLSIKRFMGQQVLVRAAANSVVFSCGAQLGRVSVPEMELQY